jgi:hypothetical protein
MLKILSLTILCYEPSLQSLSRLSDTGLTYCIPCLGSNVSFVVCFFLFDCPNIYFLLLLLSKFDGRTGDKSWCYEAWNKLSICAYAYSIEVDSLPSPNYFRIQGLLNSIFNHSLYIYIYISTWFNFEGHCLIGRGWAKSLLWFLEVWSMNKPKLLFGWARVGANQGTQKPPTRKPTDLRWTEISSKKGWKNFLKPNR